MAHLYTNQQLPTTSEQAIREFNEKYLAIVSGAPVPSWAAKFEQGVGAPRVTFPLSAFSTKFRETKAQDSRFKSLGEKSFDLKVVEYDAGYEAPMMDLASNVFAYRNWSKAPEAMRLAEARHVASNLAALLEAGTTTLSPWDDVDFFSTAHSCNPFDASAATFSNYQATPADPAVILNIQTEATNMRAGVLDVNGDKLGADPDEIWVPSEKFQFVSDLLNQDRLANGATNPLKGKYTVVEINNFTDANDWYLADSKLMSQGYDPMIALSYMPAATLGMRFWDESSDFFKDTGHIKVSQHIWKAFGLLFPHAIRKVAGA